MTAKITYIWSDVVVLMCGCQRWGTTSVISAVRRSSRGNICPFIRWDTREPNLYSEYTENLWFFESLAASPGIFTASVSPCAFQVRGVRLSVPSTGFPQVSHDQTQGRGWPGVCLCHMCQTLRESSQSECAHVYGSSSHAGRQYVHPFRFIHSANWLQTSTERLEPVRYELCAGESPCRIIRCVYITSHMIPLQSPGDCVYIDLLIMWIKFTS